MITAIEITRAHRSWGAEFGATGAYERLDGVAIGELDPAHPANRGIVNSRQGAAQYAWHASSIAATSASCARRIPSEGNGRILYEVNNRGRMMLFANLCAGKAGQPADRPRRILAMHCRCERASRWCGRAGIRARRAPTAGWDWMRRWRPMTGAPIVRRIREEFISGTRGGDAEQFRLAYEAAHARRRGADGAAHADGAAAAGRVRVHRCAHGPAGEGHAAGARLDLRTALPARPTRACSASASPRRATSSAICATARPGATCSGVSRRMRWASASRRPGAICAITWHRASTGTKRRARVRWGVHPCRRHRPGVLQHRIRPARAHPHVARGSRFSRGGISVRHRR